MSFEVDIGYSSLRGPRDVNEDFAGAVHAPPGDEARGLIAAIADGVSMGGRGLEAAQTTVMGLLADYFATPDTWEPTAALDRLIGAQNAWLADHNRRRQGSGTALTTMTALVLHGQSYTLAHVGDTRAWHVREGGEAAVPLTQDHAFDHPDLRSRLTRAIGLDDQVRVDYCEGNVRVGDCFVLSTDGVHGVLKAQHLAALALQGSAGQASEALVQAALAGGTRDNATALVIRVIGLDARQLDDEQGDARRLAPPPALKVGEVLDGYVITALVADTGVHLLYQARDPATRALVALKTLHPSRASDPQERAMLAHEAWLGLRVSARGEGGFVRVHERSEHASALYTVFDWHGGRTLEQLRKSGQRGTVAEAVAAAIEVAKALGRLHRHGVVHRDIKPGNLHLGDDGRWRIIDLGVAVSGREGAVQRELHAGTPSYINPEQWEGADADAASDLFALGVTLYQWLAGRLPYGEIEPYQVARYRRDPVALSRIRPDVPMWLDHLVRKAVARDPRQRFETAEEMLLALERGASRPVGAPSATPLIRRDPAALYKIALAVSLLFNVLLVVWLLFLPH
ncbi:bifunctional protein-serine/threonine kinase/phosphatase [Variovorax sp. J22G21]|uniref:bifunctional protein-serine/threonine kinase/phosphatase n=1 Tax=Variovorax fucosicus TaxID=3053517 RepID=UPI0025785C8C|nr:MULTISPECIES: bifunctional protein-serine/threonine kinase/phosphatase [unclassified Variovorax]MDM0039764.1 bifunctional protein-serine/threonine kinase/phosphatase [Variovorax sp. J22R193]MDM0064687.1 bifunctional protein-serine/threonine kinase/phosphatase [Variovorax sp. J22G21]